MNVEERSLEAAKVFYATQKNWHEVLTYQEEHNDELIALIEEKVFVCVRCVYWCGRSEEHPDIKETCTDCVEADGGQ